MIRPPSTAIQLGRQIAIFAMSTLALATSGADSVAATVYSFGSNSNGRTGMGTAAGNTLIATPVDSSNLTGKTITQISAGGAHGLLLADDGSVFSFGLRNATGQGASADVLIPAEIDATNLAGNKIAQLDAGTNFSLLVSENGTVFSFGPNVNGQTGQGTNTGTTSVASQIDNTNLVGKKIVQADAGLLHSLLLAEDGTVFSFGNNGNGKTGQGTNLGDTLLATPVDLSNLSGRNVEQVSAGGAHSLLLADDGSVFSFGWNGRGITGLGLDSGNTLVATPINTTNLQGKTISQVSAGTIHNLLLADDGTVFCFGANVLCGFGTNSGDTLVATPIDTTNLAGRTIVKVSAWESNSLLLADNGDVYAFGSNFEGSTGLGLNAGTTLIATPIVSTNLAGQRVTDISTGYRFGLLLAVPEPGGAASLLLLGLIIPLARYRPNR